MEYKHFSHHHGLMHHQPPGGAAHIQCSGCRLPGGSGSPVYACWQCSFFLHDQCFRATRSFDHPSHPPHPLTLVPYPTYPSNSFYCNSCGLIGYGFSYSCSQCDFDLHVHCAYNNNTTHGPPNPVSSFSPSVIPVVNSPVPSFSPSNPTVSSFGSSVIPVNFSVSSFSPPYPTILSFSPSIIPVNSSGLSTTTNVHSHHVPNFSPSTTTTATAATTTSSVHSQALAGAQVSQPDLVPPAGFPTSKDNETTHFSHPHALKLNENHENKDGKKCSGCEYTLSGPVYACVKPDCDFILHTKCFSKPREVRHNSHLDHPLTLLPSPPYHGGVFTCNACWKI